MPNPIKYSTGSETLALKKGNLYIGTGAVGKGPSETTGYYQGPNVPSGGYVIYMNKEGVPGNLSYHSAANDAQLISFTNSIAGQSYTGVNQCFDYYYSQNDKVLVNQDYPADYPYIVMDNLYFCLDAGISLSYPGTGTTWYDINGLGPKNNGTLINGPTFNSDNGGSIVFDGSDDFVDCGTSVTSDIRNQTQFTLNFWFKKFSSSNDFNLGAFDQSTQKGFFIQWFSDNNVYFGVMNEVRAYNYVSLPYSTGWFNFTFVFDGTLIGSTNKAKLYINSNLQSSINADGAIGSTVPSNVIPLTLGKLTNYSSIGKGNLSVVQLYNRALSASEVLQNYNATKSRYGL
jgi:Concanavalin A-like lectin/glucanases superfamily